MMRYYFLLVLLVAVGAAEIESQNETGKEEIRDDTTKLSTADNLWSDELQARDISSDMVNSAEMRWETETTTTATPASTTSSTSTTEVTYEADDDYSCGNKWIRVGNSCFKFQSKRASSSGAEKLCKTLGRESRLASITSRRELNALKDIFYSNRVKDDVIYIGLKYDDRRYDWKWIDGEPLKFSSWDKRKPNGKNGKCAGLNKKLKWLARPCYKKLPSICKKSLKGTGSSKGNKCESGWKHRKGFCYRLSDDKRSWERAKSACRGKGGRLASVLSKDETTFIKSISRWKRNIYIGLRDVRRKGYNSYGSKRNWVWSDGRKYSYKNWAKKQPNSKAQQCVSIDCEKKCEWYDVDCGSNYHYLCKRKLGKNKDWWW